MIVDMVKRNNEEGTAISKAEQKRNSDIPGYKELEVLMAATATIGHDEDEVCYFT
ncbi:hypothetical protein BT69DRAFT_1278134 [Atractiella rhizophila]|nr:hypothetical protein BT69DRAFT_1278134 [Atractiella rhizophila]